LGGLSHTASLDLRRKRRSRRLRFNSSQLRAHLPEPRAASLFDPIAAARAIANGAPSLLREE
jgi:hypothetical protein